MPESRTRLRVDDFDYELPRSAIAQRPVEPRDAARLLQLDRAASAAGEPALGHGHVRDLPSLLRRGDVLVLNDSRVVHARLPATRPGGGSAEVLLLRPTGSSADTWEALVRPSRRLPAGTLLRLRTEECVEVGERLGDGTRAVRLPRDAGPLMAEAGEVPLPPYIRDHGTPADRYQTVYADPPGSVAAPTAGLHLTPTLLARLERDGVAVVKLTLHIGLDTFRPLEGTFIDEHRIHREWFEVPQRALDAVRSARAAEGRVVAVGTTTVRVLESVAAHRATTGWTELYIAPPFAFRGVDALLTNFHLPRSSLLLLVTAFVQDGMGEASPIGARDTLRAAYAAALESGYRFYSFGDAMFIT